jgi:hypothetical protein
MAKYKLEYIWLDGYQPLASLRSKTQIKEYASFPKLADLPDWGFDGSSTQQAEGKSSDVVLKPVAVFPDSTRKNGVLVMCETYLHTGTPHPSNSRGTIPDDADTWFGFEQEYFFYKDGAPLGFPVGGYPSPQGPYYTGVGYKNVGNVAREIVEKHIDLCLEAGINLEGINAEVASSSGLGGVPVTFDHVPEGGDVVRTAVLVVEVVGVLPDIEAEDGLALDAGDGLAHERAVLVGGGADASFLVGADVRARPSRSRSGWRRPWRSLP